MVTFLVIMFIYKSTNLCTVNDVIMSINGKVCGDWLKEVKYDS